MVKSKLTDEQKLQYVQDNWELVPPSKREKLTTRSINKQYEYVYKRVRHIEYEKEKGEDTYPVYTLRRLLKYKKLTSEDLLKMITLIAEKMATYKDLSQECSDQ